MNDGMTEPAWLPFVLAVTGASRVDAWREVQSLWSGYGQILRCSLVGAEVDSVIVKHVRPPTAQRHPRGWSTSRSHDRKARSYQVESRWYREYAARCDDTCRVPRCLGSRNEGDEVFMVLEDLDGAGFDARRRHLGDDALEACLSWLANFHATFMQAEPVGLWETGTYWHLATRPDELEVLRARAPRVAEAAPALDAMLAGSPFQTWVHGDAKVANFCFGSDGPRVAAVDFQYVGGGCGMKDVAYLLSSCLDEDACERRESELLGVYFAHLHQGLHRRGSDIDVDALEADWRALYPVAWTDFFRFLEGWSPGHWKVHRYTRRLAGQVLDAL